jgi:hypothetical protein
MVPALEYGRDVTVHLLSRIASFAFIDRTTPFLFRLLVAILD